MADVPKRQCSFCDAESDDEGYIRHTDDCKFAGYSDRYWVSDDGETFLGYLTKMPEFLKNRV